MLKHLKIAEEFRQQIESGVLQVGDRLPSYNEVRERYGVHAVTMEKVHSLLQEEGLIVRERGRGTFVASTRTVRRQNLGIIGVSGSGFTFSEYSPYWIHIIRGMREVADCAGMQLLLLDHKTTTGWEKADGILLCDWSGKDMKQMVPPGMPSVSLMVQIEGMSSVTADDYAGARAATEYLLSLGHQRIGYIHSIDSVVIAQRLCGYRDALRESGIVPDADWERELLGEYDYGHRFTETGRRTMKQWLRNGWKESGCTALLSHNDETAAGIVEALQTAGLSVPRDVSVIGFDGTEACNHAPIPLTTVEVPLQKIGATATEMLLRQFEERVVEIENRNLPAKVKIQESTAARPVV